MPIFLDRPVKVYCWCKKMAGWTAFTEESADGSLHSSWGCVVRSGKPPVDHVARQLEIAIKALKDCAANQSSHYIAARAEMALDELAQREELFKSKRSDG